MKNIFTLVAFVFLLTFSACGPEELPAPVIDSPTMVSVKPLYSKHTNDGYKIFMLNEPLRIYTGDTVRYEINYESSTKLNKLEVYYKINNGTAEIPVISESYAGATEVKTKFEHIVWADPGATLNFFVRIRDDQNNIIVPANGVTPEVEAKVSQPLVYTNKRLYNISSDQGNSFEIPSNFNTHTYVQELKENPWPSLYALVQNTGHTQLSDKRFVPGFRPGNDMRNITFVKAPANAFSMWEQPNKIKTGMAQWGPVQTEITNAQVGEVYAFKAKYSRSDSWVIYGLLKVTAIEDDHLTSDQGGSDNDYLQFDIKYFPGYRF